MLFLDHSSSSDSDKEGEDEGTEEEELPALPVLPGVPKEPGLCEPVGQTGTGWVGTGCILRGTEG